MIVHNTLYRLSDKRDENILRDKRDFKPFNESRP